MSQLVAAVYEYDDGYGKPWVDAFSEGLVRHGVAVRNFDYHPRQVEPADMHIFWGMRSTKVIDYCHQQGQTLVCLDFGYTRDRADFASINLNYLNGKSELDVSEFSGDTSRCKMHGWEIQERRNLGEKVIVVGQIYDDMSLDGTDVYGWANFTIAKLEISGDRGNILFKPHPLEKPEAKDRLKGIRVPIFEGSMTDAFNLAKIFHTYSSTCGPEAWLNGLPATAASPVSMIYKDQFKPSTHANRQAWLNAISFRQFSKAEMRSGMVWELLGKRIIGKAPRGSTYASLVRRPGVQQGGGMTLDTAHQ